MIRDQPKPVEIVSRANFKFYFKENDAAPYFMSSGFQDMDVAVITIAGPGRFGKSFIMNFFLRYANHRYSEGKDAAEWLKDKEKPLTGFSWERESERSSTCLNMWPEFFVCTKENGDKICIIFLDTQSGDERNTAATEYSSIFAICSMISSVLILNVGSTIQETYLQQLEVFAEYGKMALDETGKKPYQKLLFLVRDWRMSFQYGYGFDGGKLYLKQFMDKNNENRKAIRELESPRENIPNAFESIECFLMPRLGDVAMYGVANEFQGTLKAIDSVFVENLNILVSELLAPGKLIPKLVNGQRVSVKELFVHLGRWVHLFNGPTMPVPTSMFNATVEANNEAAKENAINWFKDEVSRARGKNHIDPKILEDQIKKLEEQALKKFDNYKKMGGPTYLTKHRIALKKTMDILKENYFEENADMAHPFAKLIKGLTTKLTKVGQAVLFLVFMLILNDFIGYFEIYELTTIQGYRLPLVELSVALTIGAIIYIWMASQS